LLGGGKHQQTRQYKPCGRGGGDQHIPNTPQKKEEGHRRNFHLGFIGVLEKKTGKAALRPKVPRPRGEHKSENKVPGSTRSYQGQDPKGEKIQN